MNRIKKILSNLFAQAGDIADSTNQVAKSAGQTSTDVAKSAASRAGRVANSAAPVAKELGKRALKKNSRH